MLCVQELSYIPITVVMVRMEVDARCLSHPNCSYINYHVESTCFVSATSHHYVLILQQPSKLVGITNLSHREKWS